MTGATTGEFSQLLLGLSAGLLLASGAAMLRAPRPAARWTSFIFFFTSTCFAIKLWCDETNALPHEVRMVIGVTAMTSVGWFWLMSMALFCDIDRFRSYMFAAPGALLAFGIAAQLPRGPLQPAIWAGGALLQAALAILSLGIIVRSWKGDLVESRRRVRGPFMVAVALYILSLNGFDIWEMFGTAPTWYPMLNSAMLAAVTLGGAFVFLDPRSDMVGVAHDPEPPRQPELAAPSAALANGSANGHAAHAQNGKAHANGDGAALALDRAAKADLERLECLMSRDQVWKEEGLTIGRLALRASVPETQLRRLINDCLGYRNFPSYVNAHRIAAAKGRLSDPNGARVSISTIAYDIGFASLGPFNRAFKEETGLSPSEWRRKELNLSSPIPENA